MITRKSKTIALAVGDILLRRRISNMARDLGHRTQEAARAREALSFVRDGADLLILDLALPDMSAGALLEAVILERPAKRMPVILIGGQEDFAALEPLGAVDCIERERALPEALAFKLNRALFLNEEPVDSRKRVPVSITAVFTVDGKTSTGILLNMSESGVFLHTDQMISRGAHVELTFSLENELVMARGVVRWTTPGARGNLFCGSGVKFTSLPWESMRRISEFVRARLSQEAVPERPAV